LDSTGVFYYDGAREIAEYNSAETTGTLTQAYVWGTQYVDELLMMFGNSGTYFAWQDANWLVSGLTTPGGRLAEEYNYTPYGPVLARRHTVFGDGDGDGDIDATDEGAFADARDNTYNRDFDANWDGAVDAEYDEDAFNAQFNQPKADKTVTVDARAWSPTGNPYLYTGRRLDAETEIYYYRARNYHPGHKQFIQRDPLEYIDGPSMYQYLRSGPLAGTDPLGLQGPIWGFDGASLAPLHTTSPPTAHQWNWINAALAIIRIVWPTFNTSYGTIIIGELESGWGETDFWGTITLDPDLFGPPVILINGNADSMMRQSHGLLFDLVLTLFHELWHRNYDDWKVGHNPAVWEAEAHFLKLWSFKTNDNQLLHQIRNYYFNVLLPTIRKTGGFAGDSTPRPPAPRPPAPPATPEEEDDCE